MTETGFQFAVLRYIHDQITQEFINVGVAVYAPDTRYLGAQISTRYGRLSDTFGEVDGEQYRRLAGFLQRQIESLSRRIRQPQMFGQLPSQIEELLALALPPDNSALAFGGFGGGVAEDLDAELSRLFERLVARYVEDAQVAARSDQQVWQVFRKELEERQVISRLEAVTIKTATYEHTFDHAWKNERWHPIEAVSFDLKKKDSILRKANTLIGQTLVLFDSPDLGIVTFLVGMPRDEENLAAYDDALKNLEGKIGRDRLRLVEEGQAARFSMELSQEIDAHDSPGDSVPDNR